MAAVYIQVHFRLDFITEPNTMIPDPWADPEEGTGGLNPPEKSQKYRVSLQYWSGSPEKSQSYQASI